MKTIKNMTADQLRKSILQLAIQGKLVKQDPKNEPASVLVEKIYEEKKKLIAEGKIKKEKVESRILKGDDNRYYEKIGKETKDITDELPFEIPESWEWIRLYNIANIYNGNSINENEKIKKYKNLENGYNYIATKDIFFDKIVNYNNGVKIPFETQFKVAPKGNVLLCIEGGSAGRKIALLSEDVCFGNKLACFNNYTNIAYYLYLYLQSPTFLQLFKTEVSGIIGGVSINTLKTLFLPLPPLLEQKRIVERIKQIEPLLQQYDKLEKQLTKLENEITDKLKKSILQYAIEGKLVKQDPNDEPASVLLERIKAEKEKLIKEGKIKRDKNESFIYQGDDKNYYEKLPNNWVVLPLKQAVFNHGQKIPDKTFSYIDIGSIDNINQKLNANENIISPDKAPSRARKIVCHGDIIYSTVRPYLHNTCIIDREFSYEPIASTGFAVLATYNFMFNKYLFYYLLSPLFDTYANNNENSKGVTYPAINDDRLYKALICFPNIEEQTKIVNKIENLFNCIK